MEEVVAAPGFVWTPENGWKHKNRLISGGAKTEARTNSKTYIWLRFKRRQTCRVTLPVLIALKMPIAWACLNPSRPVPLIAKISSPDYVPPNGKREIKEGKEKKKKLDKTVYDNRNRPVKESDKETIEISTCSGENRRTNSRERARVGGGQSPRRKKIHKTKRENMKEEEKRRQK